MTPPKAREWPTAKFSTPFLLPARRKAIFRPYCTATGSEEYCGKYATNGIRQTALYTKTVTETTW
jgi:hypothetical protein